MIPVSRLVTSIRYSLREMQGVEWSDFEIVEAINRAASLLYSRMGEKFIHSAVKNTVIIVDDDGSTTLPSDFHNVYKVGMGEEGVANPSTYRTSYDGAYRIAGDCFFAAKGAYALWYYYIPRPVMDWNDALDVPEMVSPYLEKIAACLLTQDAVGAEQVVQLACHNMAAGEWSHLSDLGPVRIFGGRL